MHEFPCTNIHELLTPNLLHQAIKGTFKNHLVTWVNEYLYEAHEETGVNAIIGDINCWYVFFFFFSFSFKIPGLFLTVILRISAVPIFPGLRCFPDGHAFV